MYLKRIEKEADIPNSSPETSQITTEITNKLLHKAIDSLELYLTI